MMALVEWNQPGLEEPTWTMRQVRVNKINPHRIGSHFQKPEESR